MFYVIFVKVQWQGMFGWSRPKRHRGTSSTKTPWVHRARQVLQVTTPYQLPPRTTIPRHSNLFRGFQLLLNIHHRRERRVLYLALISYVLHMLRPGGIPVRRHHGCTRRDKCYKWQPHTTQDDNTWRHHYYMGRRHPANRTTTTPVRHGTTPKLDWCRSRDQWRQERWSEGPLCGHNLRTIGGVRIPATFLPGLLDGCQQNSTIF
jgi:hypothetical protein